MDTPRQVEGQWLEPRHPIEAILCDMDGVVDVQCSYEAEKALAAEGFEVTLHIAPGVAHGISPDGLLAATTFLEAHLGTELQPPM